MARKLTRSQEAAGRRWIPEARARLNRSRTPKTPPSPPPPPIELDERLPYKDDE